MRTTLDVYLHQQKVGQLQSTERQLCFSYDSNYVNQLTALPLSVALPLQVETFSEPAFKRLSLG